MAYGAILGQTPTASNVTYNNSQTSSIITGTNVQQAIDQLFTSVSNGKALIASAITDKGVSTSANDTFQQMAANIGQIESGGGTCTGSMQFSDKRGVKYIYIGDNGESKVSSSPITDNVMIGSILVVCYSTALAFPTTSGGIKYITDLDYDGLSSGGNAYLVSGNFSIS